MGVGRKKLVLDPFKIGMHFRYSCREMERAFGIGVKVQWRNLNKKYKFRNCIK